MTYDELKTKIRAYTEVDNNVTTPTVLTDTILNGIINFCVSSNLQLCQRLQAQLLVVDLLYRQDR